MSVIQFQRKILNVVDEGEELLMEGTEDLNLERPVDLSDLEFLRQVEAKFDSVCKREALLRDSDNAIEAVIESYQNFVTKMTAAEREKVSMKAS